MPSGVLFIVNDHDNDVSFYEDPAAYLIGFCYGTFKNGSSIAIVSPLWYISLYISYEYKRLYYGGNFQMSYSLK